MKIIFFFIALNYYYFKRSINFLQKIKGIFFCIFLFLEYLFVFIFRSYYLSLLIVYKHLIKEKIINLKNKEEDDEIKKLKKDITNLNKNRKIYFFLDLFYRRRMYTGISIVYVQIFMRKMKEKKNNIIFFFNYKFKYMMSIVKKKIVKLSLFVYLVNNYNLVLYFDNLKKNLYYIIFFFSFMEIYRKEKFKNIFFYFFVTFYKFLLKLEKF